MLPQLPLRIGLTLVSVALFVLHKLVPTLTLDTVSLVLVVVALLPWLQPIFKTIKLPGGIELTLQDMKQEIRAAAGAAQSAERKADLAVSGIGADRNVIRESSVSHREIMNSLARRYEEIRRTQSSGPTRTAEMTAIVREMIDVAGAVPEADLANLLKSNNLGDRLVAYSTLYRIPNQSLLANLVSSVTVRETKPFGQYWGLQAINRNLPADRQQIPDSVLKDLVTYASSVMPGSDRDYEVRQILGQLRGART